MFPSVKHQDVLPNDWQNFLCPFQKRSHHFGKMVYSHDLLEGYLVLPFFSVSTFNTSFLSQLAFFILQHLIPPHARNFCQSAGGVLHPVSDVARYEVRHKSLLCIFTSLSMLLQNFPEPVKPIVQLCMLLLPWSPLPHGGQPILIKETCTLLWMNSDYLSNYFTYFSW